MRKTRHGSSSVSGPEAASRAIRLRRAGTLLSYWQGEKLFFTNYLTRVTISADPRTFMVLEFFSRWRRPADLCAHMPEYSKASVLKQVRLLATHSLLVEQGSAQAAEEEMLLREWKKWLPAGSFHFATKDARFINQRASLEEYKRTLPRTPQPPFFKDYGKTAKIKLPAPPKVSGEFRHVLTSRRTHREFAPGKISLAHLAQLLSLTWGVQGYVDTKLFGKLALKTSPSGGARHPGEVYIVAMDIAGLPAGIYHYHPVHHRLTPLHKGPMRRKAFQYCVDQQHCGNAAALFIMTAVFARSQWKYGMERAYRVVTLDAGHLGQTFSLIATWLGLAPFTTAALKDTLIEKDLGLDGIRESVMYMCGVGLPVT